MFISPEGKEWWKPDTVRTDTVCAWQIQKCMQFGRLLSKQIRRGALVVQSVKFPTLDFGSGHDLTVPEFKPHTGLCICLGFSLSPSLFLPLPCSLFLSLSFKINKIKKTFKNKYIDKEIKTFFKYGN